MHSTVVYTDIINGFFSILYLTMFLMLIWTIFRLYRYKTRRHVSAPWQLQQVRETEDGGSTWRLYYEAAYAKIKPPPTNGPYHSRI